MDEINLGRNEEPKDYKVCVRHTPGLIAAPYIFKVGTKGEESFSSPFNLSLWKKSEI